jgi:hypothetical protein
MKQQNESYIQGIKHFESILSIYDNFKKEENISTEINFDNLLEDTSENLTEFHNYLIFNDTTITIRDCIKIIKFKLNIIKNNNTEYEIDGETLNTFMNNLIETQKENWDEDINKIIETARQDIKDISKNLDNKDDDENYIAGMISLTLFLATFSIVNNWEFISINAAPVISWLNNTALPITASFLGTNIGLTISISILVLITAAIVTAISINNSDEIKPRSDHTATETNDIGRTGPGGKYPDCDPETHGLIPTNPQNKK